MIPTSLFLAQAQAEPGIVSGLAGTFYSMGVDGPRLLSQIFLFVIVALCLKRFAYQPILAILEQRQATIKESLENAARVKEELAAAQTQRAALLAEANEKANAIVAEAKQIADLQSQKQQQETARQIEASLAAARAATEQERERMLRELRGEVLRLVVDATGRATGKVLTADDQKRIQDETLAATSRN
ncbi:MAG: F0F1 ATP synthase subunit B [Verrucomicrobium sp.]|nr:F0F1 ATP synthase subunit B [Verrucomicrobium sp.]